VISKRTITAAKTANRCPRLFVLLFRTTNYLAPLFPPANQGPLDVEAVGAVREKCGLEMDMGSIPVLAERHGLAIDAPPPSESLTPPSGARE